MGAGTALPAAEGSFVQLQKFHKRILARPSSAGAT